MKNFAILKESLYNEVINLMDKDRNKGKKLIKGYIDILKNHPILKEALDIHNNLEHGSFINEDVKHGFIIENLNAIRHLDKEKLRLGLDALDKFIKSNHITYTTDLNLLSEKISNLMINIGKVNKSIENNKVIEYIIETVSKREILTENRKPVSHKIFKKTATKNYNNKFGNLSEVEKKIIKNFFIGDKKLISEQYNELTSELKTIIDEKINSSEDKDIKIKFYEVKDKISTTPEDITLEHFKKILDLKENLL